MTIELNKNYLDIPFADYRAWPEISQSNVKDGCTSMLLMKHFKNNPKPQTDAMALGSAVGYAFLEPELLPEKVVLWNGARRAGIEWNEFKDGHKGKIILTKGAYTNLKGMIKALRKHPQIKQWITSDGETEVSRVAEIMGVRIKGRVDKLTGDPIVDLKSSGEDLDEDRFASHIVKMGYHIQGAIYCKIFDRKRFILGVVESKAPHDVVPYEMDPDLLAFGLREAKMLISSWKYCCEKEYWPGRSEEIVTIGLPKWLKDEAGYKQITTGGVPVKLNK